MSRPGTPMLKSILAGGSYNHHYLADLYYDGSRRLANIPVGDVQFKEDSNGKIQQSGSFTVKWTDAFGTSISPTQIADFLAPFGAEVYLYSIIEAGPFSERIELGQFTITNVPSAMDEDMIFRGQRITIGSVVEVEFKERLVKIQDDRFDVPSAAFDLSSTWNEIGRLTELQLSRTITDKPITRAVVYEEDRLDAVYNLFETLDGIPHMTADGALSARSNNWPALSHALKRGKNGQIVRVGRAMSPEQVYNRVAFRGKTGDQQIILASAEINTGPLRARNPDGSPSPFRRKTYFLSSEYITNAQEAMEFVQRELPRVSRLRSIVVPVKMLFNPLIERGDVISLERPDRTILGRVLTIDRGERNYQDLTVEVADG